MEGFCRACLNKFNEPTELYQYCESNRRLFIYCTGLQVKCNDNFTFQLCKECYLNLKFYCKFKKLCRTSDKKIKSYLAVRNDKDGIDFSTYLENIEDTLPLRLPIVSRSTSPVQQKNYDDDDDNESTCTSIQNFMSDILQGEEIPPTEARIVREVIQEEADILDDSLDSHWLEDDASVDNDFGVDFNFAGFSTPNSINNDHCYTPRRLTNNVDEGYLGYYTSNDAIKSSKNALNIIDHKDMPLLGSNENTVTNPDNDENMNTEHEIGISNENDMPLLDNCDIELDGIVDNVMNNLESEYHTESAEPITVILNKGVAPKVISPLTNELELYMSNVDTHKISTSETKMCNNETHSDTDIEQNKSTLPLNLDQYIDVVKFNGTPEKHVEVLESPVKCELEKYIHKAEIKRKLSIANKESIKELNEKCAIDMNLELALKNDDSQEFSLDQLLISPQVCTQSGASTPTINNILFGNMTPTNLETIPVLNSMKQDMPKTIDKVVKPRQYLKIKDLNKIKESKLNTIRKVDKKSPLKSRKGIKIMKPRIKQGIKDIQRLKELVSEDSVSHSTTIDGKDDNELDIGNHCETPDIDISENSRKEPMIEFIEVIKENNHKTSDIEMVESDQIKIKSIVHLSKDSVNKTQNHIDDDLQNISMSNLLIFDDTNSVDMNISLSSDFLIEDIGLIKVGDKRDSDEGDGLEELEDSIFKKPFSPPDDKYDFDKNLCKICDKTFMSTTSLKHHFNKVHKQQLPRKKSIKKFIPKICPKCGKSFRDKSNFNRHMKAHEDPDSFRCEYCTLEFPSRGRFNQHMRSHADEIAAKGDDDLNSKRNNTENSTNKQSGLEGKIKEKYICSVCGKEFKTGSNYKVHMKRHNKIYAVHCALCGKGFIRKYDMESHLRSTHKQERSFACEYCPKKYNSRHLLVGHMYRHLGKEKFSCKICDRNFVSNQYLQQHYRTEMCARNRKALEDMLENTEVTVSYRPVSKPLNNTNEETEKSCKIESESKRSKEGSKTETVSQESMEWSETFSKSKEATDSLEI